MSRTHKGKKPVGWEHWGNIRDKEQEAIDSRLAEHNSPEDTGFANESEELKIAVRKYLTFTAE